MKIKPITYEDIKNVSKAMSSFGATPEEAERAILVLEKKSFFEYMKRLLLKIT